MEAAELAPGAEANIKVVCNVRNEMIRLIAEKKGLWPVDYDQPVYVRTDACLL